jgi:nucleoside-diphosphate-sugar epimerase
MSNVFVSGATGVIGRRVVPALLQAGHRVTAVARAREKKAALQMLGASVSDADLFSPAALAAAVAGHDVVINLATHMPASSSRMLLPGAWSENDRIRRIGSANLVNAAIAAGAERFIQESFAPVYPDRGDQWIEEDTPIAPVRYNRSIADAEKSAERFTGNGRSGIVLRFAFFYGPDARFSIETIRSVRRGRAPLPGPADAFISSASQDDAASAVVAAMDASAGVYNVVEDEPVTHREYFDSLARALEVAPPKLPSAWLARLFGSLGKMMARSLRISNRKLREATGWRPRFPSVREGWPAVVAALGEDRGSAAA